MCDQCLSPFRNIGIDTIITDWDAALWQTNPKTAIKYCTELKT
jgi:hypothetical protein